MRLWLLILAAAVLQGAEPYVNHAINLRLPLPQGWRRAPPDNPINKLRLLRADSVIYLNVEPGEVAPEQLRKALLANLQAFCAPGAEVVRSCVQEERPTILAAAFDAIENGRDRRVFLACWVNEGLCYQVIGVSPRGRASAEVEQVVSAMLRQAVHPARRKQERKGEASVDAAGVEVALGGGLALLSLPAAAWQEITFQGPADRDWENLELATFQSRRGGTQLTFGLAASTEDPAEALAELRREVRRSLQAVREEGQGTAASQWGEIAWEALRGVIEGEEVVTRYAVALRHGVRLRVRADCFPSRSASVGRSWEDLLAGIRIADPAVSATSAWPLPKGRPFAREASNAFSGLLGSGRRLMDVPHGLIPAVSGDGAWLLAAGDQPVLQGAGGQAPRELEGVGAITGAAFSSEPLRLACASGRELLISAPIAGGRPLDLPDRFACAGEPGDLAFDGDRLVAVLWDRHPGAVFQPRTVATARLVEQELDGSATRVLASWPLARFASPVLSATGRLAVLANRDLPRTQGGASRILLVGAGGGLVPLGPVAAWTSLAWLPDGTLAAVREQAGPGLDGPAWELVHLDPAGGPERWRPIPVPSDRIWPHREGLMLAVRDWRLPAHRQGLWLLPTQALAQLPAASPVRRASSTAAALAGLEQACRAALGGDPASAVPTPALLARLAEAFAAAVQQELGVELTWDGPGLDRLPRVLHLLRPGALGRQEAALLGVGAWYGEALRRRCGAQWDLAPLPFGTWFPSPGSHGEPDNPYVRVLLPFDACHGVLYDSESQPGPGSWLLEEGEDEGRQTLLVWPAWRAAQAVRALTPPAWEAAWEAADAGAAARAWSILQGEADRLPGNLGLQRLAIAFARAADLPAEAQRREDALAAIGKGDPEALEARGDALLAADPEGAFRLWRSALQAQRWGGAPLLLKLAEGQAKAGRPVLALSCLRRARLVGNGAEASKVAALAHAQLRRLMPEPESGAAEMPEFDPPEGVGEETPPAPTRGRLGLTDMFGPPATAAQPEGPP